VRKRRDSEDDSGEARREDKACPPCLPVAPHTRIEFDMMDDVLDSRIYMVDERRKKRVASLISLSERKTMTAK
jgi:hypothetical protein